MAQLDISLEDLKVLIHHIDNDFGFEYNIDKGYEALEQLKELVENAIE